jgi:hypothetical protein
MEYVEAETENSAVPAVRAEMDRFEEGLAEYLRQGGRSEADGDDTEPDRVPGLRIIDKHVDDAGARVTVYLLVRYRRESVQAARHRLNALADQADEPVEVPRGQARQAAEQGRIFTAIGLYLDAAIAAHNAVGTNEGGATDEGAGAPGAAAGESDADQSAVQRNLTRALELAERLTLEVERERVETQVSADAGVSFSARVAFQPADRPVPDARVLFTVPRPAGDAGTVIRSQAVAVDTDGIAAFSPPPPEAIGSSTVTVTLAFDELLAPTERLTEDGSGAPASAELAALRAALEDVRASIRYVVRSRAREIPTGVIALDADIAGNPMEGDNTATGLLQTLNEQGFMVERLPFEAAQLSRANRPSVVDTLSRRFGDRVERVILASGRIEEFNESDGFIVTVTGSAEVHNLDTGRVIYSTEENQRSRGSSSSGAMSAAFRSLGNKLAEDLAENLP